MTITTSVNYSQGFKIPSASTDIFDPTMLDGVLPAFEAHDHTSTKGLAVGRITTGAIPQFATSNSMTLTSPILAGSPLTSDGQMGYGSHLVNAGDGTINRQVGLYQLARIVGDGVITTFDFPSIAAFYETLEIVVMARTSQAATQNYITLTFNNDSGANYDWEYNFLVNGGVTAGSGFGDTSIHAGVITGNTAPAGTLGLLHIRIPGYARTVFHKMLQVEWTLESAAGVGTFYQAATGGRWLNTAAVTRVTIGNQGNAFVSGSVATLYGIP